MAACTQKNASKSATMLLENVSWNEVVSLAIKSFGMKLPSYSTQSYFKFIVHTLFGQQVLHGRQKYPNIINSYGTSKFKETQLEIGLLKK